MPSQVQFDELVALLDGDGAAVLHDGLERFREPARYVAGLLETVVLPRNTEQVRVVIGWARRHGVRLLPQGANTGLVGASTPGPEGGVVVLSTERLRGPITIDATDRTAIVYAGTRLSELNEQLAEHGLTLPIDLGADPSLGGMVATNTGGARMLRYGDMRRHVLGVEAVLADESVSVVDELSVLRKDNTGFALTELMVGSGGALGVVTQIAIEVDLLAEDTACAWLIPVDGRGAIEAVLALEQLAPEWLSAYEVISAAAMAPAIELVDGVRSPFPGDELPTFATLVEFAGRRGAETCLVDALAELSTRGLIIDALVAPPADAWGVRHSISEGLKRCGTIVGFDVSVPRSRLPEFLDRARAEVHELLPRCTVADFGHWGDGGVHCSVVVPFDAPLDDTEDRAVHELVFGLVVDEFGGSFSAEHGIGPVNAEWWRRGTSKGSQRLSRAIKQVCDPLDLLGHPGMPYS